MSSNISRQTRFSARTSAWTLEEVGAKRDQAHLARRRPSDFDLAAFYCSDVRIKEAPKAARSIDESTRRSRPPRDIAARLTPELVAPIKAIFSAIGRWRDTHRNAAILHALDDAALKDIGVYRCAIEYLVQEQAGGTSKG